MQVCSIFLLESCQVSRKVLNIVIKTDPLPPPISDSDVITDSGNTNNNKMKKPTHTDCPEHKPGIVFHCLAHNGNTCKYVKLSNGKLGPNIS